ncbi:MAG: S-methyl-5-thioribose kinase [Gammaproteobacteria bacterium]
MGQETTVYEALAVESIGKRLSAISAITDRIGADSESWEVAEIGDGNLNLVFIVTSSSGKVIVKQALPYVRLVGDSWPLPLSRAFFEYQALVRQEQRDPGSVPEVFFFDEEQALIVMEFLDDHAILRAKLMAGERVSGLAERLGCFVGRTAFRGSDLCLDIETRKTDTKLFLDNLALCNITEELVFTDPYFEAERNHHTEGLDEIVATLRSDVAMKAQVQHMLTKFTSNAETMLHGDLHTGSIMCTSDQTRIIDPEFVTYGPTGFDLGMLIANFLMAYFSQPAHRDADELDDYQEWICSVIAGTVAAFREEFSRLWHSERSGTLYPHSLFEDQGHSSQSALDAKLRMIWEDAIGFCGIEMHRRTLSLAHNADFETIDNPQVRGALEARNLMMGRELILGQQSFADCGDVLKLARDYSQRTCL